MVPADYAVHGPGLRGIHPCADLLRAGPLRRAPVPPGVRESGTDACVRGGLSGTALSNVVTRRGRSKSVTLPRVRTASPDSAESAPRRVITRTGRSRPWRLFADCCGQGRVLCGRVRPPQVQDRLRHPLSARGTKSSKVGHTWLVMPADCNNACVTAASLLVGANTSTRLSCAGVSRWLMKAACQPGRHRAGTPVRIPRKLRNASPT